MNLRRDPLDAHMRAWLAHWVQPSPEVAVRASGCISFPVGCGILKLPSQIGAPDSQTYVPSAGPVMLPTADSMARNRASWTRMRSVG